jgi:hypothetical protein
VENGPYVALIEMGCEVWNTVNLSTLRTDELAPMLPAELRLGKPPPLGPEEDPIPPGAPARSATAE